MWEGSTLPPRALVLSVLSYTPVEFTGGDILDRLTSLEEVDLTAEDARQLGHFLSRNREFAKGGNRRLKLGESKVGKKLEEDSLGYGKKASFKAEQGRRAGSDG